MSTLVTQQDVTDALDRIDAAAANINAAVVACPPDKMPPAMRAEWMQWYGAYQQFSSDNHPHVSFSLVRRIPRDEIAAYERELQQWQAILAPYCTIYQPMPQFPEQNTLGDVELGIAIGAGALAAGYVYFKFFAPWRRR